MNWDQFNQKEMKQAKVYMYNRFSGILTEDENGFHFQYDQLYLVRVGHRPRSIFKFQNFTTFEST